MRSKSGKRKDSIVTVQVELTGIKEAMAGIERLEKKNRIVWMKKALRRAGAYVLRFIRIEAKKHDRSNTLYRSLKSKLKYYKKTDTLVMLLGVRSWFEGTFRGRKVVPHRYLHLILKGHKEFQQQFVTKPGKRYAKKDKRTGKLVFYTAKKPMHITRRVGAAKADNFIAETSQRAFPQALQLIRDTVKQGLENAGNISDNLTT